MNRLAPLIALLLCTVACSATGAGAPAPQNGAQGHIAASPQNAQSSIFTETRPATGTPNAAGTLAVLSLQATEKTRLEAREMLDRTATMQALANQYTREAQTQAVPQATAREKALSTQNAMIAANMTQSADNRTATYVAPRDEATAAVLRESVKYAPLTALAYPVANLMLGAGVLVIAALLGYAVFGPRKEAEPQAEPEPTRVVFVEENTMRPIPTPPGEYSQFLVWARVAIVSGYVSYRAMVGAGKPFATNEAYRPLWEWARDYGISEEKDGRNVLSTRGRDYCGAALRDTESPAPLANNAENTPPAGNTHENNAYESGGAVLDEFDILPKESE